jgi:hypothetical protein
MGMRETPGPSHGPGLVGKTRFAAVLKDS